MEADLNKIIATHNSSQAILFKDNFVITENTIYDAYNNNLYGSFKNPISDIAISSDNTVYIAFKNQIIEVYKNTKEVFNESSIGHAFRAVTPVSKILGSESTNSDYLSQWSLSWNFTMLDWTLSGSGNNICIIAENDYKLYVFDSNFGLIKTVSLPIQPYSITSDNSKIYITFKNSKQVYIVDNKTYATSSMFLSTPITATHTEARNGILYALSDNKFYEIKT